MKKVDIERAIRLELPRKDGLKVVLLVAYSAMATGELAGWPAANAPIISACFLEFAR